MVEIQKVLEQLDKSDEPVLSTLKALYREHFIPTKGSADASDDGAEQFPLTLIVEADTLENLRRESDTAFAQLVTLASKNPSNKNYYSLLILLLQLENAISKETASAPLPASSAAAVQNINTYNASQQSLLLQLYVLLSSTSEQNKNQISNVILKEFAPVKNYFLYNLLGVLFGLAALAVAIGFAVASFRRGIAENAKQDKAYDAANQKMVDYCGKQNNGTHAGQWLPDIHLNACHYTEDEDDHAWILEQCCLGIQACVDALPALIQEFNVMCDSRHAPGAMPVGVILVVVALVITCCFGTALYVKIEACGKPVKLPFQKPAYEKMASLVETLAKTFPEAPQELLKLIAKFLKTKEIDPAVKDGLLRDLKAKLTGSANNIAPNNVAIPIPKETDQLLPKAPPTGTGPSYGIQ